MDGGDILVVTADRPGPSPAPPRRTGLVFAVAGIAAVGALVLSGGEPEAPVDTSLPAIRSPSVPTPSTSPGPAPDPLVDGWSRLTLPWPGRLNLVERIGERVLAMGMGPRPIGWWSDDAATWTPMTFEEGTVTSLEAVASGPRALVAIGTETSAAGEAPGLARPAFLVSNDRGRSWREASGGRPAEGVVHDVAWVGGRFVAAGTVGDRAAAWTSTDGEAWSPVELPDAAAGTVAASIVHHGPATAILGGDPIGPAAWTAGDERFRRLSLMPPTGDRAWGRVDLVEAEPGPSGTWVVMTRSRLGGWGRLTATSDLSEWRWATQSFFAVGADFALSPHGLVVTGRTEAGHTIGRPRRTGLVPISPDLGGVLAVASGPHGSTVAVGQSQISGPVIWVHGVDGGLVVDRDPTG